MSQVAYLPVVDVIEKVLYEQLDLFEFQVRDTSEMGPAEGLTCPNGNFIRIREDVYQSACDGGQRARFTLCHELGHYFLHTNQLLARLAPNEQIKPYRSAECQANRFASTLLMPEPLVRKYSSIQEIADNFGVSKSAAKIKMSLLGMGTTSF
ncbi:MAG: ImmA/IrrE family metallo-endopeptidase [Roseibium sp.]